MNDKYGFVLCCCIKGGIWSDGLVLIWGVGILLCLFDEILLVYLLFVCILVYNIIDVIIKMYIG